MSQESLHAAMNFPLHREVLDEPRTVYSAPVPDCEETMGMLGSPWLWYGGGALCIAAWTAMFFFVRWLTA